MSLPVLGSLAGSGLTWLDSSPTRFFAAAWSVFSLTGMAAVSAALPWGTRRWWRQPALFAGLLLLTLLAFRWPALLDNREISDPDESEMISGALTLTHNPDFWRSVDGTTHGPIDVWILLAELPFAGRLDYIGAHLANLGLAWVDALCAWLILRHLFGDGPGRLLALPLLAALAFPAQWMFLQYGSEQVPDALIALASLLLVTAWGSSGSLRGAGRLFATGLLLGAVPFAKLQVVPVAAWVAIFAIGQIIGGGRRRRAVAALAGGGLAVPLAMFVWILARGLWPDFFESYLIDNIRYAGERWFSWAATPGKFLELSGMEPDFLAFLKGVSPLCLCPFLAWPWMSRLHRRWAVFALGLALVSIYATMAPGRLFPHYLQVALFPIGLLAGVLGGAVFAAMERARGSLRGLRHLRPAWAAAFLACGLTPLLSWRAHQFQPDRGEFSATHGTLQMTGVAREILKHARPGEALGIWGWGPTLWVQTGLVQATRDGNNARQLIGPIAAQPFYRARYLADLERSRPPVFVDTVGGQNFAFANRKTFGHEVFGGLDAFIRAHYRPVADLEGMRVYVREDRP